MKQALPAVAAGEGPASASKRVIASDGYGGGGSGSSCSGGGGGGGVAVAVAVAVAKAVAVVARTTGVGRVGERLRGPRLVLTTPPR